MKNTKLILLICGLFVAACSNYENLKFDNDLENIRGWSGEDNNAKSVVKGIARSGKYCSKTDTAHQYGYIFKIRLSEVSQKQLKKVKASLWANIPQINNDAQLVLVLDSLNKNMFWKGKKLSEMVKKTDEWTEVIEEADLSGYKPSKDYVLSIYIWNTGKTEVYSDDYCVKFFE